MQQATEQYEGFGLFLRAMTGLDYEAAAIAFAGVGSSQTFTPQQDDHLELLIEVLAKNGTAKVGRDRGADRVLEPARLSGH